ncbi:rhombosortase [Aestuariibacter sp. A3R04]|uniref:rhombosortase n=1 Tax=Aestuariibacter sp. A3R04 TaxID=2841571 RepID=UPI002091360F|nr:rhombosortase [Aestuariibacter sp. A3R04]
MVLENKQALSGPLLLTLLCILAWLSEPWSGNWLAYDRYAIQGFETWRLLSANLVHTNGYHLLLNITALFLLTLLHGAHYHIRRFIKLFVWCAILTSLCIYCFSPHLIWYAGLSGALHGVFVWGACMDIRAGYKSGWLLLAGVTMKIFYEQRYGSAEDIEALINAAVAIDAHLYGGMAGLMFFLLFVMPELKRLKGKINNL